MKVVNPLIALELEQHAFYMDLSVIANGLGYLRAEKFFQSEAEEERGHFVKWINYVTGRGNSIKTPKVDGGNVKAKSLYELIELSLEKEIEVSEAYQDAAKQLFAQDQLVYQEIMDFLKIQNEAIKFFTDACALLEGLDKTGELVAEHSLFED